MKGVLLVAHGSRVKATEEVMTEILNQVKEKAKEIPIQLAYMEFSEETIQKGLQNLIDLGVDDVRVIPHFLFEGIHIQKDIPEAVQEVLVKYPNVKIEFSESFGSDPRLIEMITERIQM